MSEKKRMEAPLILLAAGGTGGHLFPAEALAGALSKLGARVALVTDHRVASGEWASRFPGEVFTITAGTVTGGGLLSRLKGGFKLLIGLKEAVSLMARLKPDVVVGFGGYPTVPPVLAARIKRIPTLIHEANAVMGRANHFLAPRVSAIATGFPIAGEAYAEKSVFTGNPVRPPVLIAAAEPYPRLSNKDPVRLLVFGGSQGARVMADVVPGAIEHLPPSLRDRLMITQQARDDDQLRVERIYRALGVKFEIAGFFADLPHRIADSHLVIGRAGAMTVTELCVIGRPGLLVPLPGALDQDQAKNAEVLVAAGGAIAMMQPDFTPNSLAHQLERLLTDPDRLRGMADAAKAIGVSDAATRLAQHVLSLTRTA